jgi:membrane-bound serine protease (ClpP class)
MLGASALAMKLPLLLWILFPLLSALSLPAVASPQDHESSPERGSSPEQDSSPERGGVTHIRIDRALDVGTQALLHRAIAHAEKHGNSLLLEIDTPGGEIELMWQMANAIMDASDEGVRTVAWVNDRALSAGALIAIACDELTMRSHATIGSATPVTIGPTGMAPVSEDEDVKEKNYSHLRSEFRGVAVRKGRPPELAEAMIDRQIEVRLVRINGERRTIGGVEWYDLQRRGEELEFLRTVVPEGRLLNLSGVEAIEFGLADGLRESLDEVVGKLGLDPVDVVLLERSASEEAAGFLYLIGPLLLVAGLVLAYLELKAPGFGLPGALAIGCFAVMLFGRYLVGLADIPDLILMTVGVVLIAVEIFVLPGTVWVGLVGSLAVLGGLVWSLAAAGSGLQYALDRRILFDQAFGLVTASLIALMAVWALSRILPRTPLFHWLAVAPPEGERAQGAAMPEASGEHAKAARVGAKGRALTALRPVGKVVLDADASLEYEARSEGEEIPSDCRVRVIEVQASGRLLVGNASPPKNNAKNDAKADEKD